MPIEYINRKHEKHYLKAIPTKNGKERYYIIKDISRVPASELLNEVPLGFEFYEYPEDGKVVLRKIVKSSITDDDLAAVDEVMQRHETVKDYILHKNQNAIYVCVAHLNREEFPEIADRIELILRYYPELRFEKVNDDLFRAQRFCNLSRYYGWITIESNENLEYLANKYCYHINKESLLDFWIEGEKDW